MIDRILDKASRLPEIYQDIELDGKVIKDGKRGCSKRWDIIKPFINPHDVILDVGSSLGYFAHKIATTYPDSLVISIESDPLMCQIQRDIYEHEGIYNVIVCQHRMTGEDLKRWTGAVEFIDVALVLSVLHHFKPNEIKTVLDKLRLLANNLMLELPHLQEVRACGQNSLQRAWKLLSHLKNISPKIIGVEPSHLDNKILREIKLITGEPAPQLNLDAYFGADHGGRHKFKKHMGKLNDKFIIPGINVWNLLHFNIVWPTQRWWMAQAKAAYEGLEFKSDVRPWNLLVTSTGIKAIDYTTKFPEGDQAEFKPKHMDKLLKTFAYMKPVWK